LETFKSYETKPADLIQGRIEEDYLSKLNAAITTVRGVNKTDVLTLAGAFRTVAGIMKADMASISALPGLGSTKVSACSACVCNCKSEENATLLCTTVAYPWRACAWPLNALVGNVGMAWPASFSSEL